MSAYRGSRDVLLAKPLLVAANVACRVWEAFRSWCHSFPLTLSGSASGGINQSVDTHARAVMWPHAGVSWRTKMDDTSRHGEYRNRRIISWMLFEQASKVVELTIKFALGTGGSRSWTPVPERLNDREKKKGFQSDAAGKNDDSIHMFVVSTHVQVHQLQK